MRPIFEKIDESKIQHPQLLTLANKFNKGIFVVNHFNEFELGKEQPIFLTHLRTVSNAPSFESKNKELKTFLPVNNAFMTKWNDIRGRQQMAGLLDENFEKSKENLQKNFQDPKTQAEKIKQLDTLKEEYEPILKFLHLRSEQLAVVAEMIDIMIEQISSDLEKIKTDSSDKKIIEEKLKELKASKANMIKMMQRCLEKHEQSSVEQKTSGKEEDVNNSLIVLPAKPPEERENDLIEKLCFQLDEIFHSAKGINLFKPNDQQLDRGLEKKLLENTMTAKPVDVLKTDGQTRNYFIEYIYKNGTEQDKQSLHIQNISTDYLKKKPGYVDILKNYTLGLTDGKHPYIGLIYDVGLFFYQKGAVIFNGVKNVLTDTSDAMRGNFISVHLYFLLCEIQENKNVQGVQKDLAEKYTSLLSQYQFICDNFSSGKIVNTVFETISNKVLGAINGMASFSFTQKVTSGETEENSSVMNEIDKLLQEVDAICRKNKNFESTKKEEWKENNFSDEIKKAKEDLDVFLKSPQAIFELNALFYVNPLIEKIALQNHSPENKVFLSNIKNFIESLSRIYQEEDGEIFTKLCSFIKEKILSPASSEKTEEKIILEKQGSVLMDWLEEIIKKLNKNKDSHKEIGKAIAELCGETKIFSLLDEFSLLKENISFQEKRFREEVGGFLKKIISLSGQYGFKTHFFARAIEIIQETGVWDEEAANKANLLKEQLTSFLGNVDKKNIVSKGVSENEKNNAILFAEINRFIQTLYFLSFDAVIDLEKAISNMKDAPTTTVSYSIPNILDCIKKETGEFELLNESHQHILKTFTHLVTQFNQGTLTPEKIETSMKQLDKQLYGSRLSPEMQGFIFAAIGAFVGILLSAALGATFIVLTGGIATPAAILGLIAATTKFGALIASWMLVTPLAVASFSGVGGSSLALHSMWKNQKTIRQNNHFESLDCAMTAAELSLKNALKK